ARENNITQIVIGKSESARWFTPWRRSVVHDLVRKAGEISIHVIAGGDGEAALAPKTVQTRAEAPPVDPVPYAVAAALVALGTGLGMALHQFLAVSNVALVYLTAVVITAVRFGLMPSLFAALASVLAFNFFFLPPIYTFTIADPENVVALFFFLLVAISVSNLTAGTRRQIVAARKSAKTTAELYGFSRKVAATGTLDDLLWATTYQVSSMLKLHTVVLLPDVESGGLTIASAYPPEDVLDTADMAAARWCWEHNHPAGRGADTLPGGKWLFLPLRTGSGPVGRLGLNPHQPCP